MKHAPSCSHGRRGVVHELFTAKLKAQPFGHYEQLVRSLRAFPHLWLGALMLAIPSALSLPVLLLFQSPLIRSKAEVIEPSNARGRFDFYTDSLIVGHVTMVLTVVLGLAMLVSALTRAGRRSAALQRPQTLRFSESGTEITSRTIRQSVPWQGVTKLREITMKSRSFIMDTPRKAALLPVLNETTPLAFGLGSLPSRVTLQEAPSRIRAWRGA